MELDFIIKYIEIGIIVNFIALAIDLGIGVYIVAKMGLVETEKMAVIFQENERTNSLWSLLHLLIPFFNGFLIIIQIILIKNYFNGTATSVEVMLRKLDNYKIFKRFR